METFFDCHTHEVYEGRTGFLIALDGDSGSAGGYSNREVIDVAMENKMIPVQYVTSKLEKGVETDIIKFHPRREKYLMEDIACYIKKYCPKGVILDTLNQPYMQPNDYWWLVKKFPNVQFLLSHAGGFDVLVFLQIAMFQENAWIDFSHVQHLFGWCGENITLPHVKENIDYALMNERIYKKILFGSDNMRNEVDLAIEALERYKYFESYEQVVNRNYKIFLEACGYE